MNKPLQIYAISLADDCYYLGVSYDFLMELREMQEGKGPQWTKLHKPITIHEIIKGPAKDLDIHVKYYMKKYGIGKVRGGSYNAPELESWEIQELEEELGLRTPKPKSACEAWHCGPCGKPFQTIEEVFKHLESCSKAKLEICPSCQEAW